MNIKTFIELEYESIRRLNLELMNEYGIDEWAQTQNEDLIYTLGNKYIEFWLI